MVHARPFFGLLAFVVACGSSSNNGTADGGGGSDSGLPESGADTGTDAGSDAAPAGPLGFTPSNFDLSGLDLTKAGDVVLSGANCFIQPSSQTPNWPCADTSKYVWKTVTRADQSKMVVFVVKSLRIEASTILLVATGLGGGGDLPFAIVALDTMTLIGSIKVSPGTAGGGANAQSASTGTGPGGGLSGAASSKAGGGGASFCGVGGKGSAETGGTAFAKSVAYGAPELVPLVGGSQGGVGDIAGSGGGGGAFQLVAGTSIELKAGAFLAAPGQGGGQGGTNGQEASGGGSGGSILLESPTVTIAGAITANGGGGGGNGRNGGASGDDGHDADATAAKGGSVTASAATDHGGNAGGGDTADGADALSDPTFSAAGGGGGTGRIRINTTSGAATLGSATLSPSAKTSCVTQGTLKK